MPDYFDWGIVHRFIGGTLVIAPPVYHIIKPFVDGTGYLPKLTQSDIITVGGFTLMGVACYYVGDRMRARKVEEQKIKLLLEDVLKARENKVGLSQRVDS